MANDPRTPLGQALCARQAELNLSQAAVGEALGVARGTVWHWISGTSQPSVPQLEVVRHWLGISKAEMYTLIIESESGVAEYRAVLFGHRKANAKRKAR